MQGLKRETSQSFLKLARHQLGNDFGAVEAKDDAHFDGRDFTLSVPECSNPAIDFNTEISWQSAYQTVGHASQLIQIGNNAASVDIHI